jgi:hypothetical protein
MLSEHYRELLTAYVDGELSARQHRTLQKLLHRSAEARALLKQMQADSHELQALPPARLEQDLSDSVLKLIAQRQLQPPRAHVASAPLPTTAGALWPYVAAAAALLIAVGAASFLFFVFSFEPAIPPATLAKDQRKSVPKGDEPKETGDATPEVVEKSPVTPEPLNPMDPMPVVQANSDQAKPIDEPLTAPSMEMFELKKIDVALPVVVKLHQLDQDAKRKALLDELKKTTSFRLEIPSSNGSKALDRLQAACKGDNLGLLIERSALDRFQKPVLKTNYVVYVEDITPEELVRWLRRIAVEDSKPDAKKQVNAQLEAAVMTQTTKQDREQLSKLLGVEPAAIDQNTAAAGQGGASRAVAGKQTALVMAYNPDSVRPKPNSPDIKRWLENRKPPRAGTLQVLFVLRSM